MSSLSIAILAVGMSIDALFASVGRGAGAGGSRLGTAMGTGIVFGAFAALSP